MCPARIAPLKNQEELVEVLPLLKDRFKNVKLLLVGAKQNKKYLSYLKELSRKLGVAQDVVFTGVVSAEDFPRYYNMADVVVLPSVSEGFPSSLIESMSCGRPTVASNIQSNMEVGTFGKDILYYRLNDLHDLYDKITCILNDQTLASALSKSARQTAIQKYDWNVVARRTLDAYFRLIRLR
jgi:glycosyltransferase involved in cell wall biosynthesis